MTPTHPPIRLLVVIEAASVAGPVKNLLAFCQWTQSGQARSLGISIEPSLATYTRGGGSNPFIDSVHKLGLPLHLLPEKGPFDFALFQALKNLAATVQPHILQTHNVKTNFLVKASGLHRLYPWISFQHGYTATDLKSSPTTSLTAGLCAQPIVSLPFARLSPPA